MKIHSIRTLFAQRIFGFIVLIGLAACANSQPPSGGAPDKTLPHIVQSNPSSGTLNFHGKTATIEFSKYVNREQVKNSFFIAPPIKTELSWSGRTLEIEFPAPLDSATTYALSLGADYADLAGNKPEQAFTLIFSTGSKLDSGVIRGKLYDDNPSGAFIFLYALTGINPDTLNPAHTKPRYKTQVGTSGAFEFKALSAGSYRIFAIRDEFRNDIFDENTDAFGANSGDIVLAEGGKAETSLRIVPPKDKIPPKLYGVTAQTNRRISAEFSEKLDTLSILSANAFVLSDSAYPARQYAIRSVWISPKTPTLVEILTDSVLAPTRYILTANVRDSAGNMISDSAKIAYFSGVQQNDTLAPRLLRTGIADSAKNIGIKPTFRFLFSTALDTNGLASAIEWTETGGEKIPFSVQWMGANLLQISPERVLSDERWYRLRLPLLRGANGVKMRDSSLQYNFQTADSRSLGSISGLVRDSVAAPNGYVLTLISSDRRTRLVKRLSSASAWDWQDIPAGKYVLSIFDDVAGNGEYFAGKGFPFQGAARFTAFGQEITVRPRWESEGIILVMPKLNK